MFTDERRVNLWHRIRQHDLKQFAHLLPMSLVRQAAEQAGAPMGRGALNLVTLVWLSISCAFNGGHNFAGVLTLVLQLLCDAGQWPLPRRKKRRRGRNKSGKSKSLSKPKSKPKSKPGSNRSKHDPHGAGTTLSEEAFVQARRKVPQGFWMTLILLLGEAFQQQHGDLTHYHGLRLLALDGTLINLPMWRRLRNHFGTARNGKGPRRTQARLVMLQLPRVRLPLAYELTPLEQGERTVAARLLSRVQRGDLVLMDRGFWSYGLFHQMGLRQAFFAVRLMNGVKFKTLRRLGDGDLLVRWTPSDRQWKKQGLPRTIELRVIHYQVKGFRPSAIVTNQLNPNRLSREQWLGLASSKTAGVRLDEGLYHQRWQIETTFCELKVRQGLEGSLRGRTPETIAYEIAGHVLLYLLVRWLMVESAIDQEKDALSLSFLNALRELERISPLLLMASPQRAQRVLLPLLLQRIAAHQVIPRPGRHYSRPGDTKTKNKGAGKREVPSKLAVNET
jgi:hypothetical protein